MIPTLFRPAASAAILLCLGVTTAAAQTTVNTTESNQGPSRQIVVEGTATDSQRIQVLPPATGTEGAATAAQPAQTQKQPESVQQNAVRVPAMGTAEANASIQNQTEIAPPKPKKRVRVVRRFHEDEIVYVQPRRVYAPHYYYAPRPYHRFGYGYGPGFVYGW